MISTRQEISTVQLWFPKPSLLLSYSGQKIHLYSRTKSLFPAPYLPQTSPFHSPCQFSLTRWIWQPHQVSPVDGQCNSILFSKNEYLNLDVRKGSKNVCECNYAMHPSLEEKKLQNDRTEQFSIKRELKWEKIWPSQTSNGATYILYSPFYIIYEPVWNLRKNTLISIRL